MTFNYQFIRSNNFFASSCTKDRTAMTSRYKLGTKDGGESSTTDRQPPQSKSSSSLSSSSESQSNILSHELKEAIHLMVANISKSFIVDWYTIISPTNHDFVASCDSLIDEVLTKLAELCVKKSDKYKIGQLLISLLHEHILNGDTPEKKQSIEHQIDNFEYDICQNTVVRLFGLLSNENLRKVVFTNLKDDFRSHPYNQDSAFNGTPFKKQHARSASYSAHQTSGSSDFERPTRTTSALYTLVIAMLTKAAFMPIIDVISNPKWLYALIIWLCQKEVREKAKREEESIRQQETSNNNINSSMRNSTKPSGFNETDHKLNQQIQNQNQTTSIIVTKPSRSIDLEEGINIATPGINFGAPICDSLKRPLDNIEIYATEEVKSTGSCYVLYCIRYDGLCYKHPSAGFSFIPEQPDVPIIDKRQTHTRNRRLHGNEPNIKTTSAIDQDLSGRKSFRRSMTIKRRFREFVLLQLRLEENPKIRPYMKNIPKPTKLKAATQNIFSLPGINNIKLDQSTIKLRQRFLERFLIALNSSPFIANSYEFKEFFSYNINPAGVNITRSKSTILQVNLNKVFVDSVRSAFSLIRSTLPGDDHHSLRSNPDPDAWLTELQQSTLKLHVQTRTSHSKTNLERYIDSKLLSMNDSPTRSNKTSSLGRYYQRGSFDWRLTVGSRDGSLKSRLVQSNSSSSNLNSSPIHISRTSSSSISRSIDQSSRSSSTESIYHDASSDLVNEADVIAGTTSINSSNQCNSIQICDSVPIASKFIDIIYFSITRNSNCTSSPINLMARFIIGKTIERYALKLLEAVLTLDIATFCINGITSSIWDESDDPPLDVEHATLEDAVVHLTKLVETNYVSHTFLPKQMMNTLISKQIGFYLSQLASQKRNKFVIYSFFVHLLEELENSGQP